MTFPLLLSRYKSLERGGVLAYWQKVLNIAPANLIGYWRLNETSGTTANDSSAQANNGAYKGAGEPLLANAIGPDGVLVPSWDGSNDYCDIFSAGLNADFERAEGTLACWIKVSAAGVWTDAASRVVMLLLVDANNYVTMSRSNTNNTLNFEYKAGATSELVQSTSIGGSTAWNHLAITWSKSSGASGEVKAYINGAQVGTTQETLGNFSAATLLNIRTAIGAGNISVIVQVWSGWLAHAAVWSTPLTATQILNLATV